MIYIMRHGQTDWNLEYKVQGRTDIPLNEAGIKMAQKAQQEIDRIVFDCCYSSPLIRAHKTAEIALEHQNCPIYTDDRLQELSFGICEGDKDIFKSEKHPLYKVFKDPVHYEPVEGGESFEELYTRCRSFLDEVIKPLYQEGKNVLIVAHGALNCAMIGLVRETPLTHFWDNMTKNCELVKLID